MSDNVTKFPGAGELPDNPLQLAQPPIGFCRHDAVVIDEHTRTITCSDPKCGAVLDAFDFLRTNARTVQMAWQRHRQVSQQAHEIAERVGVLKKEEQRLRAMLKRLQDKTGAIVDLRGAPKP